MPACQAFFVVCISNYSCLWSLKAYTHHTHIGYVGACCCWQLRRLAIGAVSLSISALRDLLEWARATGEHVFKLCGMRYYMQKTTCFSFLAVVVGVVAIRVALLRELYKKSSTFVCLTVCEWMYMLICVLVRLQWDVFIFTQCTRSLRSSAFLVCRCDSVHVRLQLCLLFELCACSYYGDDVLYFLQSWTTTCTLSLTTTSTTLIIQYYRIAREPDLWNFNRSK